MLCTPQKRNSIAQIKKTAQTYYIVTIAPAGCAGYEKHFLVPSPTGQNSLGVN